MNPVQKRLVKAVQAELARVKRDIKDRCPAELRNINAQQNALRTCIEATLNSVTPYDQDYLVELAIRVASYAISAAPMEDQDFMVARFLAHFADAHMRRVAEGKVISSTWQMNDGREQPNHG